MKPIIAFKMADASFVDQTNLMSGLTEAPNLMDLNPFAFENLIANLFGQMGLESKLTRSAGDGGGRLRRLRHATGIGWQGHHSGQAISSAR
ncbi:hypothetical protein [Bosea sp. LC85]|uniref:hypothetical protein n=1 Tax=Bosea sp. LC85 TaxID=1502851 RepID=UPI0005BAA1FD|nr:hypothetical protein [Bosea sp. LC85]